MVSRYTRPWSFEGLGFTNYGGQEDTETILPMYLWISLRESWRWSLHGLVSIEYNGTFFHPPFNHEAHDCILRDIPLPLVSSGCENSGNLRELALQRMKDFGAECRDVRFREVGVCLFSIGHHNANLTQPQIHEIHHKVRPERVELLRRDYTANGGWETFLSYEDPEKDILVGLLRLRKCSDEGTFRPELVRRRTEEGEEEGGGVSIVRELHVYGGAVPVHGRDPTKFQHQASLIESH